jgi:hypothetical protein
VIAGNHLRWVGANNHVVACSVRAFAMFLRKFSGLRRQSRRRLALVARFQFDHYALDEAWDRLPPKLQATMLKTTLAERILKSAAEGERNRERLREAALRDLAA